MVGALSVLAAGTLIGTSFAPGAWYAALEKPWFTPPPWAFGPIWSLLYLMIGWAGVRAFALGIGRRLWLAQMALNFAWSPVFFGFHMPAGGLVLILVLLAAILAFIRTVWPRDRLTAALFLPYLAWVCLASAVNAGVVWLNPLP